MKNGTFGNVPFDFIINFLEIRCYSELGLNQRCWDMGGVFGLIHCLISGSTIHSNIYQHINPISHQITTRDFTTTQQITLTNYA